MPATSRVRRTAREAAVIMIRNPAAASDDEFMDAPGID